MATCDWEDCDDEATVRLKGVIYMLMTWWSDVPTGRHADIVVCDDHYESFSDRVQSGSHWSEDDVE